MLQCKPSGRCVPEGMAVVAITCYLAVVPVTMDLFQHRYYRLNKTMMTLIGQWPYQSALARRGFLALLTFLSVGQIMPVILALVKYRHDWRILLDCAVPTLFYAVCSIKLFGFLLYSPKTLQLLNRIRADWQVWACDREVNTLHEYARQGHKMTAMYTAAMFLNIFIFMTQPIMPKIIDVLLHNGTEAGQLPFPADYYHLDVQKYYFYLIAHSYLCVFAMTMVSITSDIMLIVYVQHGCGIFGALGRKLERIVNNCTPMRRRDDPCVSDKGGIVDIASCVNRHNDAIEYAAIIEATYSWTLLLVTGFGMILINAIGLQIVVRANGPAEMIRFIVFAISVMLHFYVECHICQTLTDHSSHIHFYIHNSQWYRLTTETQKALQLMTMRCSVPCELTGGNLFVLSLKTYGLTLRTAMSYFAVARSMQP